MAIIICFRRSRELSWAKPWLTGVNVPPWTKTWQWTASIVMRIKQKQTCSIYNRSKFRKRWKKIWNPTKQENLNRQKNSESASTNEEWIFHPDLKNWQFKQYQNSNNLNELRECFKSFRQINIPKSTIMNNNRIFHHIWLTFGRILNSWNNRKAIVCCKAKMCLNEILTNCMGFFPWKATITESF